MKILSQLSGGLDSTLSTLLSIKMAEECTGIFFKFKQPYEWQEYKAVNYLTEYFTNKYPNYKGTIVKQVDINLHHDENSPSEYIPVRNLVLGAISANVALSNNYNTISVGSKTVEVREDDPYSFSDCSVQFYSKFGELATLAAENTKVEFIMPLINNNIPLTKKEVIEEIIKDGINVKIIWSCYSSNTSYCGECYHCQEIIKTGYWDYFK